MFIAVILTAILSLCACTKTETVQPEIQTHQSNIISIPDSFQEIITIESVYPLNANSYSILYSDSSGPYKQYTISTGDSLILKIRSIPSHNNLYSAGIILSNENPLIDSVYAYVRLRNTSTNKIYNVQGISSKKVSNGMFYEGVGITYDTVTIHNPM